MTGGLQEDWKWTSAGDLGVSSADTAADPTGTEVYIVMKSSADDDRTVERLPRSMERTKLDQDELHIELPVLRLNRIF